MSERLDKAEAMNVHLLSKCKQMVLERRQDKAEITTLKAALKAYENPHTPPSKRRPKKTQRQIQEKDINGNIKSGGRKKGHRDDVYGDDAPEGP